MRRPVIGVTPLWDEGRQSIWMLPGYLDCVKRAGGLPLILPLTDDETLIMQIAVDCDGFLFSGGQNVSPELYHEQSASPAAELCAARDSLEAALFKKAVWEDGKPALGICRGMQLFNALLGGTLYQDLETELVSRTPVSHYRPPRLGIRTHQVILAQGNSLSGLFDSSELLVNSYHHQGIKALAEPLQPLATAPDGLIEAITFPGHPFLVGVQWHPELLVDTPHSISLFKAFIEAVSHGCSEKNPRPSLLL
ncbi:MAG: gamma-glutamyl-gamma-aminobutyrate hydrolase family protein [Coriobacteriales bacterium]|jgi:putative glutamine amidotransferase|nr:gamma-glutamyl-gamma-aminobutyrate hydrolase family protein [Coriobacteriales bacterium]